MIDKRLRSLLLLALVVPGGLLLARGDVAAENGCVSAACHATLLKASTVHAVAEGCETCHESVTTPHPKGGAKTFKLTQDPPELCVMCHQSVADKSQVHFPVTAGMCTTCHNPHASEHAKLLTQTVRELCQTCHAEIVEKAAGAPVMHAAVAGGDGCPMCHSPHASDHPTLMLNPEKETCLMCHGGVLTEKMKVLHGPIAGGKCTPCHDPHGSAHPKLLAHAFPPDTYVAYASAEYPLCFSCHKREMVESAETSAATNFRDGERNLHYLHVNDAQKGRSCRVCHELHGSAGPKLVAASVPFGKWNLPLKFSKTETGGGCSPGCHRPRLYER